jgi:cyanophycin synthetase
VELKLTDLKVMRGPNYWCDEDNQVIVMLVSADAGLRALKLDRRKISELVVNLFPPVQLLDSANPLTEEHEADVVTGTKLIEYIALKLQKAAGMNVRYGRSSFEGEHGLRVVFSYEFDDAGRISARAAVKIANAVIGGRQYDSRRDIQQLTEICRQWRLGPSTASIVREAMLKNIPYRRLNHHSLIIFGYGNRQQKIRATIADTTCGIGIEIAKDKDETKSMLQAAHIPTPVGELAYTEEEVREITSELGFPLVIKPYNGNHGKGVITRITTADEALNAFRIAREISSPVLIERFIEGDDFRLILVNFKLVAVAKRTPPMITGDGKSTVAELIDKLNSDPKRGEGHESALTRVRVDEITSGILRGNRLTTASILENGRSVFLKHTANISSGGSATDVTDEIHPYNVFVAERIARMLNLNICGIDMVSANIGAPLNANNGAIVEVNAGPGLRMHQMPSSGKSRNVASRIIDMMFPGSDNGRIPLVAVTGSSGKTTTTRIIAHMAKHAGYKVGYSTSDGIYIQDHNIYQGDCTGPVSAQTVLYDPTIDFAVLECARGGILRAGLAFTTCDVSVITNISADHIGEHGVDSVEEMGKVKFVVARTTSRDGLAILNADDRLSMELKKELKCNIGLFSMHMSNPLLEKHCQAGGIAAGIEDGYLVICRGQWKTRIERIADLPLSFDARSDGMVQNILAACLAGAARNFSPELLRTALRSFLPDPRLVPGRMNIFKFREFDLMLDYTHNIEEFRELKNFLGKTTAPFKVGVIAAHGDRREEDLIEIGSICASAFDQIIIRHDVHAKGKRSAEEITNLLIQGVEEVKPGMDIKIITDELEAIKYTIDNARRGSFITVCTERITESVDLVQNEISRQDIQVQTAGHPQN